LPEELDGKNKKQTRPKEEVGNVSFRRKQKRLWLVQQRGGRGFKPKLTCSEKVKAVNAREERQLATSDESENKQAEMVRGGHASWENQLSAVNRRHLTLTEPGKVRGDIKKQELKCGRGKLTKRSLKQQRRRGDVYSEVKK